MATETKLEIFEILSQHEGASCRALFERHIAGRGGVVIWRSQDLSFPRGDVFTPKIGPNGEDNTLAPPHWAYRLLEVVTDIKRFRFVKGWYEIQRCKIALTGPHGSRGRIDLTEESTKRVKKIHARLKEEHPGKKITYRFDPSSPFEPGQRFAIFEIAEWDE